MKDRYFIRPVFFPGSDVPSWTVWDVVERREVSWVSDDSGEMAAKALLMNYAAKRGAAG